MAFITSNSFDAVNDFKSIARKAKSLTVDNNTKLSYGTPNISMQGKELVNLMERFFCNAINDIEDPAFDFVQFHIDWTDKDGLFGYPTLENTNCAWAYLTRIGEKHRADLLLKCMDILKSMFDNYSTVTGSQRGYYLRSIEGLSNLDEDGRKIGVPYNISLTMVDDICWRVRSVSNMLEEVCYDRFRQLEILPVNMRRFNAIVLIKDCRDLHSYLTTDAMQRLSQATTDEARQQIQDSLTVADHLFMSDSADTVDFPDQTQSMIIKLFCCEFNTRCFPDSVNNLEQTEYSTQLNVTALGYDNMLLAPAIGVIIQNAAKTAAEDSDNKQTRFAKVLAKAKASLKAQAAATLASYTNVSYNTSKSMLMNLAYDKLEDSGAIAMLDKAKSLLNGNITGAMLSEALAKSMANEVMYSTYFKEGRMLDSKTVPGQDGYFTDKRDL